MSKSISIIDTIKAPGPAGTDVELQSKLNFKNVYYAEDFTDDEVINKRAVVELVDAVAGGLAPERIKIAATTSSPFSIDMTTGTRPLFGDRPTVIKDQAPGFPVGGSGYELQEISEIDARFYYLNADFTSLRTILIISPDGATFSKDTYIWLKI